MSSKNTSQDPEYEGPVGFEKKLHKTHFGIVSEKGGNERVKVKTKDGFTYLPRIVAEEEGYEIIVRKHAKSPKL